MRLLPRLLIALPLLAAPGLLPAASGVAGSQNDPLAQRLAAATQEAVAAEARARQLEQAAEDARNAASRLRARQAAAAEAITAAEARISAAEARSRMIAQRIAERRARLEREQAPAGALLAGLAAMASRPPILAVLDSSSTDEMVQVRILLDSTLPQIRQRTAALSDDLERGRKLQQAAEAVRAALLNERQTLAERRKTFALLEDQALSLAEERGSAALGAGDEALARSEEAASLSSAQDRARAARRFADRYLAMPAAPPRPAEAQGKRPPQAIRYVLPASAPVTRGFGEVSPAGIRSRGITLATRRGTELRAPADGIIRFAGGFRRYDGIVIIDHGRGWMSLLLNAATPHDPGSRVRAGQVLGRALGPVEVELSHEGRHQSPALIAGSYQILSNGTKED